MSWAGAAPVGCWAPALITQAHSAADTKPITRSRMASEAPPRTAEYAGSASLAPASLGPAFGGARRLERLAAKLTCMTPGLSRRLPLRRRRARRGTLGDHRLVVLLVE